MVVGADGICGVIMEHSESEGITVLRFLETFLEHLHTGPREDIDWSASPLAVERMTWKIPPSIREAVVHATEELQV